MSSDLLGTAVTGLRISQSSLNTTGHNISNAGVDGYSRQRVQTETNPATLQGGFYVGNGARVANIERQVNEFLTQQFRIDTTLFHELDIFQGNINQLDTLLSDTSTGLSGALESFFASLQNGADDPTSVPSRQLIISESENLADRFNTIFGRLVTINNGLNTSLESAVSEVNALVRNIADLNGKIADANGAAIGEPNDLLDQRDQTLRELAKYVSYQTYDQGFGELNILIAGGQNLVVGTQARELEVTPGVENPSENQIVFVGDVVRQPLASSVIGGEIGGLFRFRDEILAETYNEVGRVAITIADTFNQQNAIGINLNNDFGENFFFDVNQRELTLSRVIASQENMLPNDRVLSLNITDTNQLPLSDYRVELVNDGLYTITRVSDGQEIVRNLLPGGFPFSVEFDGLELIFERGSFQAGDIFTLQPIRSGARDFSSALIDPAEIAFGLPLLTDTSLSNRGSGEISPGDVLDLRDSSGNTLPLFSTPGIMSPPLLVRFLSDNIYEVLDNSDPGNPVALSPPIGSQRYVPGAENFLFGDDPGETLVQMNGSATGLPVGSLPVIGGGALLNAYPSESITVTRASLTGGSSTSVTMTSVADASARTTASTLNNISGVDATASTYAEIFDTQNLTLSSPLQLNINGEDLIEYEFDAGLGAFVVASHVPDPATDQAAFNDYVTEQINASSALQNLGIFALAGRDAASGTDGIFIRAAFGDNIDISLTADAAGPDTIQVGDGSNPTVALAGNGAGITSAVAVGGTIDVRLEDGVTLLTTPVVSGLFGDSSAANFSQNTYLGIQASIRGIPQRGDTFTLNFNLDAASDNRNALALANLEATRTMGNGVATFSDSYSALVETIGIETSSSNINRNAADQVLQQSENLRNSVSAVNLDEEAADLIRFEQMYAANAQVISVARDLFDTLIGAF